MKHTIEGLAGAVVVVSLLVLGCGPSTPTVPSTPSAPPTPRKVVPTASVTIETATADAVAKEIADFKGNIVVVDTWATTCPPCVKEFPELVKLFGNHARDGVQCISVSVDEAPDRDRALTFLKDHQANFPNYLLDDYKPWANKWNIKAIPVVLVFGRDGRLVRKFDKDDTDNPFTYADVEKLVQELIKGNQPAPATAK